VAVAELSAAVRRDRVDLRRTGLAADSAVLLLTMAERRLRRAATVVGIMRRGEARGRRQSSRVEVMRGIEFGLMEGG
jgi:hypothetical protein